MKKAVSILALLALLLVLVMPAMAEGEFTKAQNIEEFLAALKPGARIELAPGTYDLTAAKSYGMYQEEGFYTWMEVYDGYELQLRDLDDVIIRAPEGALFEISPRYANVLVFMGCSSVTLEGITAGHTEGGECGGDVICLNGSSDMTITDCKLYGCGEAGIFAEACTGLYVSNSEVYGCSWGGIDIYDCYDVLFSNVSVHDNGKVDAPVYSLVSVYLSRFVDFMDCTFENNNGYYAINNDTSEELYFGGCTFNNNFLTQEFLPEGDSPVTMEGCAFRDTPLLGGQIYDIEGNPVSYHTLAGSELNSSLERPEPGEWEEELDANSGLYEGDIIPAAEGYYFEVSTPDEFLYAIGPKRVINVTDTIVLSDAELYAWAEGEYWHWEPVYDGNTLIITGVNDLAITCKESAAIMTEPRYADVLSFMNSQDIELDGVTAGHTEGEPGSCSGDVIRLSGCRDVEIENSTLYGCGVIGVSAMYSSDVDIEDTEIYGCSGSAVWFNGVTGAEIEKCFFHDNGSPTIYVDDDCTKIKLNDARLTPGAYEF